MPQIRFAEIAQNGEIPADVVIGIDLIKNLYYNIIVVSHIARGKIPWALFLSAAFIAAGRILLIGEAI